MCRYKLEVVFGLVLLVLSVCCDEVKVPTLYSCRSSNSFTVIQLTNFPSPVSTNLSLSASGSVASGEREMYEYRPNLSEASSVGGCCCCGCGCRSSLAAVFAVDVLLWQAST